MATKYIIHISEQGVPHTPIVGDNDYPWDKLNEFVNKVSKELISEGYERVMESKGCMERDIPSYVLFLNRKRGISTTISYYGQIVTEWTDCNDKTLIEVGDILIPTFYSDADTATKMFNAYRLCGRPNGEGINGCYLRLAYDYETVKKYDKYNSIKLNSRSKEDIEVTDGEILKRFEIFNEKSVENN